MKQYNLNIRIHELSGVILCLFLFFHRAIPFDYEGKQQYYNYIETGRSKSKSSDAYKEEWKFYYNPEDKSFIGDSYRTDKENYSIVQIRPNI